MQTAKLFIRSFAATLAAFSLLTLLLFLPFFAKGNESRASTTVSNIPYAPRPEPTVLQILVDIPPANCYALATLNNSQNTLSVTLLPKNALQNSQPVFSHKGPTLSAEEFFHCKINTVLYLNEKLILKLALAFGGVSATVQEVPSACGEGWLPGGLLQLQAPQILKLLKKNEKTAENLQQQANLLGTLLLNCCNAEEKDLFALLQTQSTNASRADILHFKQLFLEPLTAGIFTVAAGTFMGEYYLCYN